MACISGSFILIYIKGLSVLRFVFRVFDFSRGGVFEFSSFRVFLGSGFSSLRVFCLDPFACSEEPPEAGGDHDADYHGEWEAPPDLFHSADEVHAEEACDECGEHEYDGYGGEHFHDSRHVVVDDVGVGVHCGVEDGVVDGGHLARLAHLDVDVLDHVGVEFVDGEFELEF